ncbi:hypothetical protein C8R48DRAFT_776768 [Suillus tomentosus]|nr:hypothetical protein C8R48DRAFT_776768 [Suillus tomentosus]
MSDLNEAIELNRVALIPRPPDHNRQSIYLNPLAMSLHDGFQQFRPRMISDASDAPEDESTADHATGLSCFPVDIYDYDDWTNFGHFLEVREQWRQEKSRKVDKSGNMRIRYSCDASVILRTHDPVHVALVVHIGV